MSMCVEVGKGDDCESGLRRFVYDSTGDIRDSCVQMDLARVR